MEPEALAVTSQASHSVFQSQLLRMQRCYHVTGFSLTPTLVCADLVLLFFTLTFVEYKILYFWVELIFQFSRALSVNYSCTFSFSMKVLFKLKINLQLKKALIRDIVLSMPRSMTQLLVYNRDIVLSMPGSMKQFSCF